MSKYKPSPFAKTMAALGGLTFVLSAGVPIAIAGPVKLAWVASTEKYIGSNGSYDFGTYSYVNDEGSGYNRQFTRELDYYSVSSGWLSAQARLYHQNGVMCSSSSTTYSTSYTWQHYVTTYGNCGLDYYYGMGRGGYYTGSGYNSTNGNASPYLWLP